MGKLLGYAAACCATTDSPHSEPKIKKLENPKFKEEEEALRRRFTEQVKMEEARFRQWEQHLIAERDRLNRDLEQAHSHIKDLEVELDQMAGGSVYGSHRSVNSRR